MKIIVTGGCGFIGHHVVEHLLKHTDDQVIVLDNLSYASKGLERLRDINVFDDRRVTVLGWDISHPCQPGVWREIKASDYILHLAAETHVDRSIANALPFVNSNALGTQNVLNAARYMDRLQLMVNFSTDEVFGPAPGGVYYKEWDRFAPTNPYAATKAAAVMLAECAAHSFKTRVATTFTMNAFGERQHCEKFIPKCIAAARNGGKIFIHSDPSRTRPGSRCWIHARNIASALVFLMDRALPGERYNIVGEERDNLWVATFVAQVVGKPIATELVDFHSSRPGHDLRYALDGGKLALMGWKAPVDMPVSLEKTIRWTLANPKWLEES